MGFYTFASSTPTCLFCSFTSPRKEEKANGSSVILGSFSNYLVTKSSVPVMVARKRLRKKSRRGPVAQVNNLNNPAGRSLASARID
ncbi:MAG: hypothetical protein IMZ46_13965 [Acidobacteria bacterium]|nr:hypothetical protein [Acidobacteriota bacterium]